MLWLEGHPAVDRPYAERRRLLESLGLAGPAWQVPGSHPGAGPALLAAAAAQGLPGVVAKRLTSPYRAGPAPEDWILVPVSLLRRARVRVATANICSLVWRWWSGGAVEAGVEVRGLADRGRPVALARDQLLAVLPPLAGLFPEGGLRRGSTVVVDPGPRSGDGATSLALALMVAASQAARGAPRWAWPSSARSPRPGWGCASSGWPWSRRRATSGRW